MAVKTGRILLCLFAVANVHCLFSDDVNSGSGEHSVGNDEQVAEGKAQYELWKKESSKPRFGTCWREGLGMLDNGCSSMTREAQHGMALKFTNCFLEETGRKPFASVEDMSENMLDIYSGFFRHTHNVCHFLKAQAWQDETDMTINRLADNSAAVATQLANSSELQGEIIMRQNESIKNQEVLIQRGTQLKQTLEDSTQGVQHMMSEFRDATLKQREIIFEVFDKVSALQDMVLGEFTGFYSLIFYFISIVISYLLTSTARTSGSRFWLFVLMTGNMVVERLIVMWGVPPAISMENIYNENTYIYERLWWCRKGFTSIGVIIWGVMAYRWKDYNKINNELLVDIQRQNSDLKRLLQNGPEAEVLPSLLSNGVNKPFKKSHSDIHNMLHKGGGDEVDRTPSDSSQKPEFNTTGYESEGSDWDSISSITTLTDRTFVADDAEDEFSDDESFVSSYSRYSRDGTPALRDELQYLRDATPLREMTPEPSFLNTSLDSTAFKRPSNRVKGRRSAPVALQVQAHTYNLRSRRGKVKPQDNPVVKTESPEDFALMVKHLQQVASRNSTKARAQVQRGVTNPALFSSDEEF